MRPFMVALRFSVSSSASLQSPGSSMDLCRPQSADDSEPTSCSCEAFSTSSRALPVKPRILVKSQGRMSLDGSPLGWYKSPCTLGG